MKCAGTKRSMTKKSEFWEVTVYHYGKHTSVAVNKSISIEWADDAAKAFEMSRQRKPQRYINDRVISAIKIAYYGDGVYEIADTFIKNATPNNMAKARAEIEHAGYSFDAVGKYKESVGQKLEDPFLIYISSEQQGFGWSPCLILFKSRKEQLQIAVYMDWKETVY